MGAETDYTAEIAKLTQTLGQNVERVEAKESFALVHETNGLITDSPTDADPSNLIVKQTSLTDFPIERGVLCANGMILFREQNGGLILLDDRRILKGEELRPSNTIAHITYLEPKEGEERRLMIQYSLHYGWYEGTIFLSRLSDKSYRMEREGQREETPRELYDILKRITETVEILHKDGDLATAQTLHLDQLSPSIYDAAKAISRMRRENGHLLQLQ